MLCVGRGTHIPWDYLTNHDLRVTLFVTNATEETKTNIDSCFSRKREVILLIGRGFNMRMIVHVISHVLFPTSNLLFTETFSIILKFKHATIFIVLMIKTYTQKKKCIGGESNPGLPRGRREFYH